MSQPAPAPRENVISLQAISRKYFTALQRQHDLLAFNLAGLKTADPVAYDHFSGLSRVMPLPQAHLPAQQMQAFARGLMLRTTINDLLVLAVECMVDCHHLCLFVRHCGRNTQPGKELIERVAKDQADFARMNLQEKFEALEEGAGIVCELEDGIFSLAAALRVLSRGGKVTNDDIAPDGALTLEFKSMKDFEVPQDSPEQTSADSAPEGVVKHPIGDVLQARSKVIARLVDTTRTFRPGELLELSDSELLGLNITAAKFVDGLLKSVDFYAKNQLGEGQGS
ncbi:MAG: hypothetical protein RL105_1064 [Verrucomicrobiota bacterium]|jgi:hypothetical protein